MDKSSFAGVALAAGGIVGGLMLEGGKLSQVLQPTAAMIVLGGTMGAVMVQFPLPTVMAAMKRMVHVFIEPAKEAPDLIREMVALANKSRKEGIISLENQIGTLKHPVLQKSLRMAVDGTEAEELRKVMEMELDNISTKEEKIPQVFESAGGFAPTVGIIGAVLGLIQVMQHLDNINEVGHGIAVAFVATIYGVAFANLLFLPAAGKLKIRVHHEALVREMVVEGVLAIMQGLNPRVLETKLLSFIGENESGGK